MEQNIVSDIMNSLNQTRSVNPNSRIKKDDFLKLLFTQLKYQDFESSVDYKDLMSQLSILTEIEQSINLNKQIEDLSKSIARMNFFYASTAIGKNALVYSDKIYVSNGEVQTNPAFHLDVPARDVYVKVKTPSGVTIRTMRISEVSQGKHQIVWDGKNDAGAKVSDGEYIFEVEAYDSAGNKFNPTKLISGRVDSVSLDNGAVFVGIGVGKFEFEKISELRNM